MSWCPWEVTVGGARSLLLLLSQQARFPEAPAGPSYIAVVNYDTGMGVTDWAWPGWGRFEGQRGDSRGPG